MQRRRPRLKAISFCRLAFSRKKKTAAEALGLAVKRKREVENALFITLESFDSNRVRAVG